MNSTTVFSVALDTKIERFQLSAPFRLAGHEYTEKEFLVVSLEKDGIVGRGEAAGVPYFDETVASMSQRIGALRRTIERGISRDALQMLLPPCGARNALDCALWDLEAKLTGRSAWEIAGLDEPRPLVTMFGCGADTPEEIAIRAKSYIGARAIKLKLTGDAVDADRVRAVREARRDVWLGVDANQSFTRPFLERLMPVLVDAKVELIEQPFAVGQDALLDSFGSPIPLAADESVQSSIDLPKIVGRFNVANIKLDKCGGVTEALQMARTAREMGLDVMVGNMFGTSLAIAPAFLVGQLCSFADLDGPIFLTSDRSNPVQYVDGFVTSPKELWG